jgi:hypothetical protein
MMLLTTARHEIAAQERAKGKSGAEAYGVAYPKMQQSKRWDRRTATVQKRSGQVRVAELQAETAKAAVVTAESIVDRA